MQHTDNDYDDLTYYQNFKATNSILRFGVLCGLFVFLTVAAFTAAVSLVTMAVAR